MQCRLVITEDSEQFIGPIYEDQAVVDGQAVQYWFPLKFGPIDCPETSVTNY